MNDCEGLVVPLVDIRDGAGHMLEDLNTRCWQGVLHGDRCPDPSTMDHYNERYRYGSRFCSKHAPPGSTPIPDAAP